MKKLILILLLVPLLSFGQTKESLELCLAFQSRSFDSDFEADNALEKILSVTGLKKNFTLLECDNVNNASAFSIKGERYIFYNKNFMNGIGGASSNLAILAHEVGHHLNNHALDLILYTGFVEPDSKEVRRRLELEADEFAGFVMARLGYSLNEAKEPFYRISNNNDDTYSTHPSRDKRLNAITEGYNRAGVNSTVNTSSENNDYVEENTSMTADEYFDRGFSRINETENYSGAISDFTKYLGMGGNSEYSNALAYSYRGVAKEWINDLNGACEDWRDAARLGDEDAAEWVRDQCGGGSSSSMSGEEYFDRGLSRIDETENYSGAISDFTKSIELGYDIGTAYYNRGLAKGELEDYYGAIADYNKTLEIDPYFALALYRRGLAKGEIKDYSGAVKDLDLAVKNDLPNYYKAKAFIRIYKRY